MQSLGFLVAILALASCATWETVRDAEGQVYQCAQPDGTTVELCYFADSSAELADATGATSCQLTDRWWPVVTNALGRGCRYSCTATGPGCNSKQGCWCP